MDQLLEIHQSMRVSRSVYHFEAYCEYCGEETTELYDEDTGWMYLCACSNNKEGFL